MGRDVWERLVKVAPGLASVLAAYSKIMFKKRFEELSVAELRMLIERVFPDKWRASTVLAVVVSDC